MTKTRLEEIENAASNYINYGEYKEIFTEGAKWADSSNRTKILYLIKIQIDSTSNCDSYFAGMTNGMEVIKSCLFNEEPNYVKDPGHGAAMQNYRDRLNKCCKENEQLQSENTHLKEQIRIAIEALELINIKIEHPNIVWSEINKEVKTILAQLTDKRESENVLAQLNEKKESK